MAAVDPLVLAVREHGAWCDLICRLHRFAPAGDARLWWSARRSPDLVPDAVTLAPDLPVLDVLGRINDGAGASVMDSFATLDLADQGWSVATEATWVVRPPGSGADGAVAATFTPVREKLVFAAWCRAWGGPVDALPAGVRRASGVTVLGRADAARFTDGGIVHRTLVGGVPVAGLWHGFGEWADVAAAATHRHPDAWIVSHAHGAPLDDALAAGFTATGPVRWWHPIRPPGRPEP